MTWRLRSSEYQKKKGSGNKRAMKLLVNYDGEFYLHDEETSSTGNVFFCVINENSIITSYYTGSFSLNPEKYRVDKIIEVDDLLDFKV